MEIGFAMCGSFCTYNQVFPVMEQLAKMDLIQFGISILIKYAIFVVIYQVIAVIVYNRKYTKATAGVKKYHADIKKIMKLQEKEEKLQLSED